MTDDTSVSGEEPDLSDETPADDGNDPRATTASATRRPTPAASAASRARRIGGATGARKVLSPEPVQAEETVDREPGRKRRRAGEQDTAPANDAVSMRKRQPRTTSARDLKAEAETGAGGVTEVPGWLRWAPAAVLSACAVAMIAIIAVAAHGVWYAEPSTSGARDQVLAAAKKCMSAVNTYNYKTLAADEKTGLACTTGAWTAQYKSALSKIVNPTATQLKASQTVQINAAGIESVSDNGKQWTTIVYGQVNLNQSGATPRIDAFSAIVRMDKVQATYKISKIDLITDPSA